MTDTFRYQDVFTEINIPESEKYLALQAKNIFDAVSGGDASDPNAFAHLSKVLETNSTSQAFWDYEHEDGHNYDRLVMTFAKESLTIAIERRDFDNRSASLRKSLVMSKGVSKVFETDLRRNRHFDSAEESVVDAFKHDFFETAARLGLRNKISLIESDQNESSSAIFDSAA